MGKLKESLICRGFHPWEKGTKEIEINGERVKGDWLFGYYADQKCKGAGFPVIDPFWRMEEDAEGKARFGRMNPEVMPMDWYVLPDTVGMYTGWDDPDGTPIFEDDICEAHYDEDNLEDYYRCEVKWQKGTFELYNEIYNEADPLDDFFTKYNRVVGNTFENREMIAEATPCKS